MNVSDKWMLEQMQQMAASMTTTLPQTGQDSEPAKTEKGETFQDMMNKAKDQKVDAPKKEDTAPVKETGNVQGEKPVQNVQKTQKVVQTDPKTGLRQIDVTPEEAALLVAGYAKLSPPMEDGTVWMVTVQDANGTPVLPQAALEGGRVPFLDDVLIDTTGEWVLEEITPEFTQALEQLLQKTSDPRTADDIIGQLQQKLDSFQTGDIEPKMEIVVKVPKTEQTAGQEDDTGTDTDTDTDTNLSGEVATTRQPLFHDVKAAPVKVGENFELDAEQPDMEQQLADTIRYAAQEGLKQLEIKLSPENLGNLTIKLTQASDGTLQVVLHTTTAKAENLLNQNLGHLNAALQGYGQNEVRVEVQRSDNSQQADQQQQQQTDPNGHNRQQQEQQRRQESERTGDFVQKLRLGLFGLEDSI